ncbi:hypothetical protein CONPUDRAFT_154582 [Coniophora puteana RWD-64-598 SS2]|uniref:F-box domain-containing protein n=1 Tax=Coniophora puteana (strain RWD-64-598) TaxID=741705 RepID=A0A5M3MP98_CONPW|nr:uncharacterized protein CONPUDRAFT_154582 [Coniophora puteana RWD-64-598 SS2]EIW80554.1 hypothetical protein CONPUDRAFT_154582 [Coniophora puteana RWD-64-598 SS2]
MPASGPQSQNAHVTFQLPPELWVQVFQHATHSTPGILEPDIYAHTEAFGSQYSGGTDPALRKSMATRRCLPLVCKGWYALSIELLYRSVWIGYTRRVLVSLCLTLLGSTWRSEQGGRSLGWYVQRLDFAPTAPLNRQSAEEHEQDLIVLTALLDCMVNLSIVVFAPRSVRYRSIPLSPAVLQALCRRGPSLRVIHWVNDRLEPSDSDIRDLFTSAPNLRMFSSQREISLADTLACSGIPTMHSLTTLSLFTVQERNDCTESIHTHFPALRHIVVRCHASESADAWRRFLAFVGTTLQSIHLKPYRNFGERDDITSGLQEKTTIVTQMCPQLQRFTLSLPGWHLLRVDFDLPPPIVTINGRTQNPDCAFRHVWNALACISQRTPTLQVVQFIGREDSLLLQTRFRDKLRHGLALLPYLRVQNHLGEPFDRPS